MPFVYRSVLQQGTD